MIQYTIENYYITVNFCDGNVGVKTKLRHRIILQVSLRELHIYILKNDTTEFSVTCDEKVLVYISYSGPQIIPPPQLRNMNQHHQIICGC